MVARSKSAFVSPQEYLQHENSAETKSEYYDGIVVAMAGASPEHDRATGNIFASLHAQCQRTPCEPFTSDMRVSVPACNRYYYPDVSVSCGGSRFESISGIRSLQNPTLIVEVLSESTEKTDRGEKLICYQTLASLTTYIIVAQDSPLVQVYERQPDDSWRYNLYQGLEIIVALPSIGCELRLADIYARVDFQPTQQCNPQYAHKPHDFTVADVANRVRPYVAKVTVGDITLWMDEASIRLHTDYWRIPIRPSREPEPLFPYYEALADLEEEIQEKEGFNVTISSGDPLTE